MAVGAVSTRQAPLTNVKIGRSKLTGGTVSVSLKQITANSIVLVSGNDGSVTGILTVVITAGTGFSITSSVGGDAGFVGWAVFLVQTA